MRKMVFYQVIADYYGAGGYEQSIVIENGYADERFSAERYAQEHDAMLRKRGYLMEDGRYALTVAFYASREELGAVPPVCSDSVGEAPETRWFLKEAPEGQERERRPSCAGGQPAEVSLCRTEGRTDRRTDAPDAEEDRPPCGEEPQVKRLVVRIRLWHLWLAALLIAVMVLDRRK